MGNYTINSKGYFKDDTHKEKPIKHGGADIIRVSVEHDAEVLDAGAKPRTKSKTRQPKKVKDK